MYSVTLRMRIKCYYYEKGCGSGRGQMTYQIASLKSSIKSSSLSLQTAQTSSTLILSVPNYIYCKNRKVILSPVCLLELKFDTYKTVTS